MKSRRKTRKNRSNKRRVNNPSKPKNKKNKIYNHCICFLMLVCIAIYLYLHFKMPALLETPYILVFPPILSALIISIWYREFEKEAEYIFSISACLSALSLCMDALPNYNNKLFVTLFQNKYGYILIYLLATISLAKVLIPIKEKLSW